MIIFGKKTIFFLNNADKLGVIVEINLDKDKDKEKMGAAPKIQSVGVEAKNGSIIIAALLSDLSISRTMLAALLSISERTLNNWSHLSETELGERPKTSALLKLCDLISLAKEKGVATRNLYTLLDMPISDDEESPSLMSYVLHESNFKFFKSNIENIIKNYVEYLNE